MTASNLAGRVVMKGHVDLEFLRIGARGRFPAGFLGMLVEVVGKVFGVGVSNLPAGRETGVCLQDVEECGYHQSQASKQVHLGIPLWNITLCSRSRQKEKSIPTRNKMGVNTR